jgi:hypothetical protein
MGGRERMQVAWGQTKKPRRRGASDHVVTFRSSPTDFADTAVPTSASTRIGHHAVNEVVYDGRDAINPAKTLVKAG